MVNSPPEPFTRGQRLGLAFGAAVAALCLLGGAARTGADGPRLAACTAPISVESGPAEMDYQTHLINMRGGVKISRCDVSVSADSAQATGLDFNNSKWVFTGKVHVRTESQGDLYADRASVEFSNNVLARALVSGSPAQFEQAQAATGTPATGHAGTIDYDVLAGTVKLTGDAWLARGDSKMDAPSITYNVREKQIEGENGAVPGGRVHMTIVPHSDAGSAPTPAGQARP
ncbi:MAG TPA: LptA/OstA family protein [Steroidobacteraceae bacterium]|nr:LptA/OstA family protein [Steroidobacteraceae bacterium]